MWPGPLVRVMEGFSLKFFIYGSNMDLAQMHERCRELSLSSFVADAHGWRLCFPRRSDRRKGGVGSLAEDQSASVWGVVFTVAERDLERLDRFEGVQGGAYRPALIDVVDQQGKTVKGWTYKAVPQEPGDFKPHKDYIDLYVRGAKHFGLPSDYVKFLEQLRDNAIQF